MWIQKILLQERYTGSIDRPAMEYKSKLIEIYPLFLAAADLHSV